MVELRGHSEIEAKTFMRHTLALARLNFDEIEPLWQLETGMLPYIYTKSSTIHLKH